MIKFLIGLLMCGSFAHAKTVDCEYKYEVRCMCPAAGVYQCGNKMGHLANNTPLKNITVAFFDSKTNTSVSLRLDAPNGELIDSYGVFDNEKDWVKAALKQKGYSIADLKEFTTQFIGVDESTKMYNDSNAKDVEHASLKDIGNGGLREEHFEKFGLYCHYLGEYPIKIISDGRTMCVARAKCDLGDGLLAPFNVHCRADVNKLCPKYASECAADQGSQPGYPKYSEVSDPYGVLIGPSTTEKANSSDKAVQ